MKLLVVGMKKQFVQGFVEWLQKNGIKVCEDPFVIDEIWYVMYKPVGREQKNKCEQYIEYRCNNNLM